LIDKQNWTKIPKNDECDAGTSKVQQKGQQVFEWMPPGKGAHKMKTLRVAQRSGVEQRK